MSNEKEFKFRIKWPTHLADQNAKQQYFQIYASYPNYVYSVVINPEYKMDYEAQKRLAISELKVRLIADISTAEFEQEEL